MIVNGRCTRCQNMVDTAGHEIGCLNRAKSSMPQPPRVLGAQREPITKTWSRMSLELAPKLDPNVVYDPLIVALRTHQWNDWKPRQLCECGWMPEEAFPWEDRLTLFLEHQAYEVQQALELSENGVQEQERADRIKEKLYRLIYAAEAGTSGMTVRAGDTWSYGVDTDDIRIAIED